jgi:hypothetical protein
MARAQGRPRARRRLSLSVRLSLLALCAALLPLAAVVGFTNYLARNTLVQQGQQSLSTDAEAKAALINAYISERAMDGQALVSLPTAQLFLASIQQTQLLQQLPPSLAPFAPVMGGVIQGASTQLEARASVIRALGVGMVRDSNYGSWSVYDASGHLALSSATSPVPPPPEDLAALKQGSQYISDVRYNAQGGFPYVYIYTPVKLSMHDLVQLMAGEAQAGQLPIPPQQLAQISQALQSLPDPTVGFLQGTLKLSYIWSIVGSEQGVNGTGSYAFIADEHGVRIADVNSGDLFTAVAPLDAATQQMMSAERRFGVAGPVRSIDLPSVASALQSSATESSFQSVASPDANTFYQFVAVHVNAVPSLFKNVPRVRWTYFVLSPLTTVTGVADDQVRTSLEAAALVAVLAILVGLLVGMRMAAPVQRSVADLQGASEALNTLASKQENSASEQLWVVDACKTGLESVRYLSDAMHQAARRIVDASNWFNQYWDRLTEDQAQRTVQHLRELSQYIDEAARRQWASSDRLDKAITVTTQVSDQLASGATAAAESAEQLEEVVGQLQRVVGGRQRTRRAYRAADEAEEAFARQGRGYGEANGMLGAGGRDDSLAFGGRAVMPAPVGPRQIAGPAGNAPSPGGWPSGQGWGVGDGYGYGQPSGDDQQGAQGWGQDSSQSGGSAPAGWPDSAASGRNGRGVRVWEER